MDRQRQLRIVFPVLLIIGAFVWGPIIFGKGQPRVRGIGLNERRVDEKGEGARLSALARSNQRNMTRTVYKDWGRNPFAPAQDPNDLSIQGVLWDPVNPKVIISGKILGIGEYMGPNQILSITQESVIIQGTSGPVELRLGP